MFKLLSWIIVNIIRIIWVAESLNLFEVVSIDENSRRNRVFRPSFNLSHAFLELLLTLGIEVGPAAILYQADQALLAHILVIFLPINLDIKQMAHLG